MYDPIDDYRSRTSLDFFPRHSSEKSVKSGHAQAPVVLSAVDTAELSKELQHATLQRANSKGLNVHFAAGTKESPDSANEPVKATPADGGNSIKTELSKLKILGASRAEGRTFLERG